MILIGYEIVTTDIWTDRQTRGTLIGSLTHSCIVAKGHTNLS
jgi:hypothetical protein